MPDLMALARHAELRGRDSSGLVVFRQGEYEVERADYRIPRLLSEVNLAHTPAVMGHSRLITNGLSDNQPVVYEGVCVLHNGIVVNADDIWSQLDKPRKLEIDTEVIGAIAATHLDAGGSVEDLPGVVLEKCRGVVACALLVPAQGKLCLFSNNGSLYLGYKNGGAYFASERFPLAQLDCVDIEQVREGVILDVPLSDEPSASRIGRNVPSTSFLG